MSLFELVPQLRENCVIQGNESLLSEFQVGDTVFLLSNTPTKKYSVISKIDAIEYDMESKIFVDKRILEKFGKGDKVTILKYNPAEAIEVHIAISNSYSLITRGEWTSNIKPSLLNKLLDLGQEISFVIPWEGGAPIVGTGIVNTTLPSPPVYIGDSTRIFIDKLPDEKLKLIKQVRMRNKEERVSILEKQIKEETINLIRSVKHEKFPSKGQKYQFKATNPRQLFKSILRVFEGLEFIERPSEEFLGVENKDYLGSAVILLNPNPSDIQLIDIQVLASENSGSLILWVIAKDENTITEILKKYDKIIKELKQGLEQKVEALSAQCPECGAMLPIEEMDVNGVVKCSYCNTISKLPKILRY
ncbi:MAG: hypothetical protein ACTSVV_06970 [Promethearchaeota archaeon]